MYKINISNVTARYHTKRFNVDVMKSRLDLQLASSLAVIFEWFRHKTWVGAVNQ